jgi:maltose/moltooligosaccharide transporter
MLEFQRKLSNPFYALLSLPATAMGFALAVQIAALSILLSEKYGLSISDIGLVWATGPFAGIVGQVLIGIISDNVWVWNGRRRVFIWVGGLLAALMLLALPQLGIIQASLGLDGILGVAIVVSLTLDLAINVSFNPTRSVIADVTPEGRPRTKGYTWMQTVSGTFGVLNYAIGAIFGIYALIYFGAVLVFFFSMIPPFFIKEPRVLGSQEADLQSSGSGEKDSLIAPAAETRTSFKEIMWAIMPLWGFLVYAIYGFMVRFEVLPRLPYFALEIFSFSATIALMIYTLSRKEEGKTREEGGLIGFQKILAAHSFTWIGVQTMFIYYFAFIVHRMPEQAMVDGFTERVLNWSFFSLNLVAAIIPVIILEPLAARYGRVKVHTLSIAVMAVGYLNIFYFGNTAWSLYLLMAVVGIGWAATISLPFAIMSQKIPQARMGLYMGLFNLSVVLPQFVSSLGIGEWVEAASDKSIIFIICAVTIAISAIAWSRVKEPIDRFTENPVLVQPDND